MMRNVLVIGREAEIVNTVVRLIDKMDDFHGTASLSIDEMLDSLREATYDVLLIGAGFTEKEELAIRKHAKEIQPSMQVAEHYGGGSGLLNTELQQLLTKMVNKFPPLPLEAWEESKITLHLWLQIVGKVKLDLVPKRNHWWHITFNLSPKGLTTGPIPYGEGSFQVDFNFKDHRLDIYTSWGEDRSFPLEDGLSVSQFHGKFFGLLAELNIQATIIPIPYDHPCEDRFPDCHTHNSYNSEFVQRFWKVMIQVDHIFKEFSGAFYGKVSPSHLYWHHMDLAVTRFSGEQGPKLPDSSTVADKEAYSHEVISAGFWAGDENVRGAAFYSYTYPSPDGLDQEPLKPASANWIDANGSPMAVLMYDDLITEEDPKQALLDFLQSSYEAGAKLANWSSALTESNA